MAVSGNVCCFVDCDILWSCRCHNSEENMQNVNTFNPVVQVICFVCKIHIINSHWNQWYLYLVPLIQWQLISIKEVPALGNV